MYVSCGELRNAAPTTRFLYVATIVHFSGEYWSESFTAVDVSISLFFVRPVTMPQTVYSIPECPPKYIMHLG